MKAMKNNPHCKQDLPGDKIFVTRPSLPNLDEFHESLKEIWESRWLTNNGKFHIELEKRLCSFLSAENCSLLCNGTLALLLALKALDITGEVITTPFTFVATTHSLAWNNITPVFCDIDSRTLNIDPDKIEGLISPKTKAIMPVHVYGTPCDIQKIQEIADRHCLKVIYDAAHAFGVKVNGEPLVNFGDASILSFHSTKIFNTLEGGAIMTKDAELKKRIDFLRNFGIADEVTVIGTGINAKMNELQAAFGLLQFRTFDEYRSRRRQITNRYRSNLSSTPGIQLFPDLPNVEHNYSYFPILVDTKHYGISRDKLYDALKLNEIYTRRYFYPLISHFPPYHDLPTAQPAHLPIAESIAERILCLPLYSDLSAAEVDYISEKIIDLNLHVS